MQPPGSFFLLEAGVKGSPAHSLSRDIFMGVFSVGTSAIFMFRRRKKSQRLLYGYHTIQYISLQNLYLGTICPSFCQVGHRPVMVAAVNLPKGSGSVAVDERRNVSPAIQTACREIQGRLQGLSGQTCVVVAGTFNCKPCTDKADRLVKIYTGIIITSSSFRVAHI